MQAIKILNKELLALNRKVDSIIFEFKHIPESGDYCKKREIEFLKESISDLEKAIEILENYEEKKNETSTLPIKL